MGRRKKEINIGSKAHPTFLNPGEKKGMIRPIHFLEEVWDKDTDVHTLEQKILTKKYSVRDITLLRILKGSEPLLSKIIDKMLPDKKPEDGASINIPAPILAYVLGNHSNQQNSPHVPADTGSTGGNVSVQDDLNSALPYPPSPDRPQSDDNINSQRELPAS